MKYYKEQNTDELYAYDDGVNYQDYTDKVLTPLTDAEYLTIVTPTAEELQAEVDAESKALKLKLLSDITVTTASGNTFDGDDVARADMLSALQASKTLGMTESPWKLADNTWATITVTEMEEAQALAIQAKGNILNG